MEQQKTKTIRDVIDAIRAQKCRGKWDEGVKEYALEIVLSLECYYWTGNNFHYHEAISHFESFVSEMAKFQTEHKKEADNV